MAGSKEVRGVLRRFSVAPDPQHKDCHVDVTIFKSATAMLRYARKTYPGNGKFRACLQPTDVKDPRWIQREVIGEMLFHIGDCGAGLVAHESHHVIMALNRLLAGVDHDSPNYCQEYDLKANNEEWECCCTEILVGAISREIQELHSAAARLILEEHRRAVDVILDEHITNVLSY